MAKRKKHRQKSSAERKGSSSSKRMDRGNQQAADTSAAQSRSKKRGRLVTLLLLVAVVVIASFYGSRMLSVHTEVYHFEGELTGKTPWLWQTQLRYRLSGGGLVRAYQVRDGVLPEQASAKIEDLVIRIDGAEVRYDPEVREALAGVDWKQPVKANAYGRETRFSLSRGGESGETGEKQSLGVLRVKYGVVTRLDLDPPKGQVIPKVVRFSIPVPELKTVVAVFPEGREGLAKGGAGSK